ncbi:MAG: PLP-dependent aminotransferase family protein [Pyrinomonadaceae bacterium]
MINSPFIMLDDKNSAVPLYRQIYEAIRQSILGGKFAARTRLPATRLLAQQLGVSRMTVVNAYEQLLAEGYLEGKTGAGTFVAAQLPEEMLRMPASDKNKGAVISGSRHFKLSQYGQRLAKFKINAVRSQPITKPIPFQNGLTAVDKFPFEIWSKIAQRFYRQAPHKILGYADPAGYRPLREAIAAHLASARGVRCDAEQVIITNGAQQALDLVSRLLLNREDRVLIEDPCYPEARDVFSSVGAKVIPVPVDEEGLDLTAVAEQNQTTARLIYVTPSHQYPLGVTMSLSRRLKLLEWANTNNALIIEDDYNSEFRYAGRPLASLQGLDTHGCVIYVGTFSKTIFPALRLGCAIVPHDLVEPFITARVLSDWHSPLFEQAILADFIAEGHFARHIRRMRALYEDRQQILIEEAEKKLAGLLEVKKADAGMHLIGWLPETVDDQIIAEKADQHQLILQPVSAYSVRNLTRGGLLLGYTAFNEKQIKQGIEKLAIILRGKF